MITFKHFIQEQGNPYHNKDGKFFNPDETPSEGSWSLYFSEPSKGRQRLKMGSKRRLSLPTKVIRGCRRSGNLKCKKGNKQDKKVNK